MFTWQAQICKGKVIGFEVCWVFAFLGSWGCVPPFSKLSRKINQLQSTVLYNPCISYTLARVMCTSCWRNYLQDYLYSKSLTFITAFVLLEPLFWFWELVSPNCLTVARGRALLNSPRMCTQSFSFKNLGPLLPSRSQLRPSFMQPPITKEGVTQSYPKNQDQQGCVVL